MLKNVLKRQSIKDRAILPIGIFLSIAENVVFSWIFWWNIIKIFSFLKIVEVGDEKNNIHAHAFIFEIFWLLKYE